MLIMLGKRLKPARKIRRVRPKTTPATLEESSIASPPASIITDSIEDCNPDIPASQDQEQSDDLDTPASQEHSVDIPASPDQEHSDDLDIPASLDQEHSDDLDIPASPDQEHSDDLDIMASPDQEHYQEEELPHEYGGCYFASKPGKYPEVPPDFETAVSEDAGRFYHNPAGGKETGWIISWYTVPGSYRAPREKSPSHRLRDDTLYDDWPGWAEGPVPVIDDIMAYIASLPTDYSAYEEEPRESRQVYI
ncbi:hypothetical protein OROHE_008608 [Orobanche hederae]